MEIKATEVSIFPTSKLVPYHKNANIHTDEQIDELINLINVHGHRDPLIVDRKQNENGQHEVMAGCGRLQAAIKAGWENLPVIFQDFKSETEKYTFMVSHNAINSSNWGGGLDFSKINADISELGPFDISELGIKDFLVDPIEKIDLDFSDKNKEIDTENFGNDLQHQCPKCGFEFNE